MYIISASDFIGRISIDNVTEPNSGSSEQLNLYIDERVRSLLTHCLGVDLFNDLDSDIASGVLKDDAKQRWKDLVNGVTYTKDGISYKWKGLKYTNGLQKQSLLADFVYHEYTSDMLMKNKQITPKNVSITSKATFLANIWNSFVSQYQGGFGICKTINFIDYDSYVLSSNEQSKVVSLIKFLHDNSDIYENAQLYLFPNSTNSNYLGI